MSQNNFSPKEVDLGQIRVGQKVEIIFNGKENMPEITSLSASCGCTKPELVGNDIKVTYKANPIPSHLKEQGYYFSVKHVNILYKGREQERLSFKAKVVK